MKTLVDQYTDRYFDPRRGQVIGVNYSPNGQAIEYELGLGNGKRMAGDALGIGIDGLSDLLYRERPRQLTPGELNDFFGGMDPGDLFGGDEIAGFQMPSDLSYPHIPGRSVQGVPNANDPLMKRKLKDRLLKNQLIQELPGFLGKV